MFIENIKHPVYLLKSIEYMSDGQYLMCGLRSNFVNIFVFSSGTLSFSIS